MPHFIFQAPIQRHTLLMDKFEPRPETPPETPWIEDGVKMAYQDPLYSKHVSRNSPIKEISAMEPAQRGKTFAEIPSTRYYTATFDRICYHFSRISQPLLLLLHFICSAEYPF